jgi:sigma-B regulation protein RsbU (phosphoserine phosphatase)
MASETRRVVSAEADVAAIQRHLLPATLPRTPGYSFAAHYQPCEAAGGDFYGFQSFDDGRLGFAIADVSGHGAAAAVMMAVLRAALSAFRVFGRMRESAPQDVNAVVRDVNVPGIFVTAFFVSLDPPTGNLFCGNCGHPPGLLRRADGSVGATCGESSLPIGIVDEVDPPTFLENLGPGDSLVLYTDGVTESRSVAGVFFGEARLRACIARADGTADGILAEILGELTRHEVGVPRADDRCVVVCTRDGA